MNEVTQSPAAGGFLVSEANGSLSRDTITIASGNTLDAGAVLGCVTVGAVNGAAAAGNTGNGAISALSTGVNAKPGVYTAICIEPATNSGAFEVEDPEGVIIGRATAGVAFSGEVNFTIGDGATDFAAGDRFLITVAFGSKKYKPFDPDATDGSQRAAALLYRGVDASTADQEAVAIVREAEFNASEIVWIEDLTDDQKNAALTQLAVKNLIAR